MRSLAVAVLVAACGHPSSPATPPPTPAKPVTVDAPPPVATPQLPAGVPDSRAGHQLAWVLDALIRNHDKATVADIEKHFHASFLAKVPAAQVIEVSARLSEILAGYTLGAVEAKDGDNLVAHVAAGTTKLRVLLSLDKASGQIAGLLAQPDIEKPASFDAAVEAVKKLAPKTALLVASVDDKGACTPIRELASNDELAIGSAFKLYVLLGLADKIAAGKLAWDGELAVRDDWKSLPSGITQNEPAGTKLTIRELATRMISISDNTATDHLLYTVGRKDVEAALRTGGHSKPALDIPFPSTRELFILKLGKPDAADAYVKLGAEQRRKTLDGFAGTAPNLASALLWKDPRHIDDIEWFASPLDLCRVMGALAVRAKKPANAPLLDVLSKNSGMPIDKATWPYVGFKGGSEPGVINLTWLLRRKDDKWFVVVLTANSTTGAVEEMPAASLGAGIVELAAGM